MRPTPIRCPHCEVVITASERTSGICPVCAANLDQPPAAAPTSPPVAEPPARRPFPHAAIVVTAAALAFAIAIPWIARKKQPQPPTSPPSAAVASAPEPPATPNPPSGAATSPAPEAAAAPARTPTTPAASAAAAAAETPQQPPQFREFPQAPLLEVKNGAARLTENADGSWTLSRLDSRTKVKLSGSTGTLRVLGIHGNSSLDASDLDAREIIIEGEIDGRSSVKLKSPHGRIEFRDTVAGQSQVSITAPDGSVVFGDPARGENRTIIDGGCRVMIIARELHLAGTVTGAGTFLTVAFLPEGILKFRELSGSARLDYRRADASLPEIQLEAGKVTGRAKLQRLD